MEKISVDLYGGKSPFGGKETPLEAEEIFCDRADVCSYYKQGKCLNCRALFSSRCMYGRVVTTKGYTRRAAKYYDFKKKYQEDPVYNRLSYPYDCYAAAIGDTLYIRTGYVDVRARRENDEKWRRDINGYLVLDCGFGSHYVFLPFEKATNDLLKSIFDYRPHAMMGGVITDWEDKRVPQILQDMKKCVPEIYARFTAEYPEYIYEDNFIGKRALVSSLKPGTEFRVKNALWRFDGEYVESVDEISIGSSSPWWLQDGTMTKVRIKVNPKMTVEINDNSIVDADTIFA